MMNLWDSSPKFQFQISETVFHLFIFVRRCETSSHKAHNSSTFTVSIFNLLFHEYTIL